MDADNKKELSASDISAILKSCAESKVRVLKYGGLYLRFGPSAAELQAESVQSLPAKEIAAIQTQIAEQARVAEGIRAGEVDIEDLQLTDPARYERMILEGKLKPDGSFAEPDDGDDLDDPGT